MPQFQPSFMRGAFVFMVRVYQTVFPSIQTALGIHGHCRYVPSCSEYAVISIQKEGPIKGVYTAFLRLLSCNPVTGI
jgi:hypothetical protein